MKIFKDISGFIGTLTFADLIFFFAVLVLMVLIVTLIYFIKINNDEEEVQTKSKVKNAPKPNVKKDLTPEMQIVKEITKNIETEEAPSIEFTEYEKDQESKAIISYEELLSKKSNYELNYEKEEVYDDLSVKKVDLDNLVNLKEEKEKPKVDVRVISFREEEAFLQALKQLQKELG